MKSNIENRNNVIANEIANVLIKEYNKMLVNNWEVNDQYKFSYTDGTYSLTLYINAGEKFKISAADWNVLQYDFNAIDEFPEGAFEAQGDNNNIMPLISGTYLIEITGDVLTITLVE